jgi:hypothetical protein
MRASDFRWSSRRGTASRRPCGRSPRRDWVGDSPLAAASRVGVRRSANPPSGGPRRRRNRCPISSTEAASGQCTSSSARASGSRLPGARAGSHIGPAWWRSESAAGSLFGRALRRTRRLRRARRSCRRRASGATPARVRRCRRSAHRHQPERHIALELTSVPTAIVCCCPCPWVERAAGPQRAKGGLALPRHPTAARLPTGSKPVLERSSHASWSPLSDAQPA